MEHPTARAAEGLVKGAYCWSSCCWVSSAARQAGQPRPRRRRRRPQRTRRWSDSPVTRAIRLRRPRRRPLAPGASGATASATSWSAARTRPTATPERPALGGPADWVPCGQTGAYCPPGYDTPTLATYDPAPGRAGAIWTSWHTSGACGRPGGTGPSADLADDAVRDLRPSWPNDPGPGSATRPIQPYQAFGNDPNDADVDGVSCEYGCKN